MGFKLLNQMPSSRDNIRTAVERIDRSGYVFLALLVVAVSCATFAALHWRGIPLSPDSWAYWQAAVSIANGSGYRFLSGDPVTAWPPLYSAYLSLWVRALGANGVALVLANAALISLQSLAWFHTVRSIWIGNRSVYRPTALFAVALYIGLYVPLTLQAAHAANLGFLCTAVMMLYVWRANQTSTDFRWWICIAAATFSGALSLLSHNANLAFVVGCPMALLLLRHSSWRDLLGVASLVVLPTLIWLIVRWQLGQLGSHPVGLSVASYGWWQYLSQAVIVVGNLIVPSIFGAAIFMGILAFAWCGLAVVSQSKSCGTDSEKFVAATVLFTCVALVSLFSLSSVTDPIGSRFVGWIPVLIVPVALFRAARRSAVALLVVAAIAMAPNFHRFATFAKIHAEQGLDAKSGPLFPLGAVISPNYLSGPPVKTEQGLLIAPPK